jgi:hemoglobin
MNTIFKYVCTACILFFALQSSILNAQESVVVEQDDILVEEETPAEEVSTDKANVEPQKMAAMSAENPAPAHPELKGVYQQFGEEAGLVKLMDVFMQKLLADERTRPFFENSDQGKVKKHLVEQFCVILGGNCTYSGRDMKSTHEGMGINRNNFNALVEDLQWAMKKQGIPFRAQNKLLAQLAPMHREIESK